VSDTNSGFWQKIKQQLLFVILYSQSQTPPQSTKPLGEPPEWLSF